MTARAAVPGFSIYAYLQEVEQTRPHGGLRQCSTSCAYMENPWNPRNGRQPIGPSSRLSIQGEKRTFGIRALHC